jgi:hypothetical protein
MLEDVADQPGHEADGEGGAEQPAEHGGGAGVVQGSEEAGHGRMRGR